MDKIDRKIEEIKATQAELDRRTSVEEEVLELIGQCRFEEAKKLLDALDDKKVFRRRKRRWYITGLAIPIEPTIAKVGKPRARKMENIQSRRDMR